MIREIKSKENNKFKEALKVSRGDKKSPFYSIEGKKLIGEALSYGEEVYRVFFSERFLKSDGTFSKIIEERGIEAYSLPDQLYKRLSKEESPQGIMGILKKREEVLPEGGPFILLDGVQDPGNCGTLLRSCRAFSFKAALSYGPSVYKFNDKLIRASMGAFFSVPYLRVEKDDILSLKDRGFRFLATSFRGENYRSVIYTDRDIIILGNEGRGVSKELFDISDQEITIPMDPKSESLNVAVAGSLIMAEFYKG